MKNYHTMLTEKPQNLTGEEILTSNRIQIKDQTKVTYSSFGKALERQTEKQFDALKYLNLSNKIDELKKLWVCFQKTCSMI